MTTSQQTEKLSWNRGRIIGPKPPLKPKHIWAIRTRLQHDGQVRDLAMFNVAIDSKLRGCDLVKLHVADIHLGDSVRLRTTVMQQKTGRPVPFELTEPTRDALAAWLKKRGLRAGDFGYSQPEPPWRPRYGSAVQPACQHVGRTRRARSGGIWHPLHEAYKGCPRVQTDRQSPNLPASAWAQQVGEHGPLSRHRGGRRPCALRANRPVTVPSKPRRPSAAASARVGWEAVFSSMAESGHRHLRYNP